MYRIISLHLRIVAAVVLLAVSMANAQRGARTVPRNLDQLTQEAELIVRGTVVSAHLEPHPQFRNLNTVVVRFHVDSTLKGSAPQTLEFRQFIWDIRDQLDNARYTKGSELLLMLGPVSQYGLRSPVGLEQGRFRVVRDHSGAVTAVNGAGNVGLLNIPAAQASKVKLSARASQLVSKKPVGAVSLTDLEEMIRSFAGQVSR
jgi:hypothetical protein